MNDLEAAAEEADGASFLQVAQKPRALLGFLQRHNLLVEKPTEFSEKGRTAVVTVLNSAGDKLHSTLLTSLASQIAGMKGKGGGDGGHDPMFKIKILIEELISRLQSEAADEATQKGFCDKGLMEAEEKRDRAAEKIRELNRELSGLETREAELTEEIADLTTEITETEQKQEDAAAERKAEKAEEQAEQAHTAFMDESQKAIDGAKDAKTEKKSSLDDTEEGMESANEDL